MLTGQDVGYGTVFQDARLSVGPLDFKLPLLESCGNEFLPAPFRVQVVLGCHEVVEALAPELLNRNAKQLGGGRVRIQINTMIIRDQYGIMSVLEQSAEARFALAHRLFRPQAGGDITAVDADPSVGDRGDKHLEPLVERR